ncbi:MAG: ABC transporter ATP-binding protein [Spirochaetota bacterium]
MIALKRINKIYDLGAVKVSALQEIDISIARGEFISIMGPSGSGKSTLLHILGMLDLPTRGSYELEGHDLTTLSERELSRIRNRHFGFIFQSFNLLPEFNALENVMMPLAYAGFSKRKRRERAQALLARLGLKNRVFHYPAMLSGGEQQRVAIARALANDPDFILADEPTGNLPSDKGREIFSILDELNQQGVTIVFVTHDEHLAQWGKRTIRLKDGTIESDSLIKERNIP